MPPLHLATFACDVTPPEEHPLCGGWIEPVRGVDDLMVTRARCCNPLHGEEIIGYVTRGKGVAVHTKRCKNVNQLMVNRERIVDVEWAGRPEKTAYAVKLLAR